MGKGAGITKRQMAIYAGVAVALAAVIFGIAAVSSPKSSSDSAPKTQLANAVRAAELAQDADQALSSNETATAISLAQQALKLDAANADAKRVIDEAKASSSGQTSGASNGSSSSGSTPSGTTTEPAPGPAPATPAKFLKPVADLAALLPTAISGWTAGGVVVQGQDALVTFEPKQGTPTSKQAVRALVSVHDRKTADQAKVFVTKVDKRVYPDNAAVVAVGAVPNAYFGTDGSKVAAVAFARGRFAVEVLITGQPGVDPATLQAIALRVASVSPVSK